MIDTNYNIDISKHKNTDIRLYITVGEYKNGNGKANLKKIVFNNSY